METARFKEILEVFLEDNWIEKKEVRELKTWLKGMNPDLNDLGALKNYTIDYFQRRLKTYPEKASSERSTQSIPVSDALRILNGMSRILDTLWRQSHGKDYEESKSDASFPTATYFGGPNRGELGEVLIEQLKRAGLTLDIAVFTLTDNRIAQTLIQMAENRQNPRTIRILTDDETLEARGSDIKKLSHYKNIKVKTDDESSLMHHKFALLDERILINGSFNWTRTASFDNYENFIVTGNPELVRLYQTEFERIWGQGVSL